MMKPEEKRAIIKRRFSDALAAGRGKKEDSCMLVLVDEILKAIERSHFDRDYWRRVGDLQN